MEKRNEKKLPQIFGRAQKRQTTKLLNSAVGNVFFTINIDAMTSPVLSAAM
jgi:hypothetical protein